MKKQLLLIIVLVLCLLPLGSHAHTINYQLENSTAGNVIWYYLQLGFAHIIPEGLDHILFIIGLCLIGSKLRTLLWQATAFTIAHTITLILSMKGIVLFPSPVIEPVIAFSIAFVAFENIIIKELKPWRILLVFFFGLVHGMGFASSLNELGLPRDAFFTSLISFNVGVEIAQVLIILAIYFFLVKPYSTSPFYSRRIATPFSVCIAVVAIYWTITRL